MTGCDFFGGAYEVGVRPRVCLSCALQHGGVELSEEGLSKIFSVSLPLLDERQRRLMVVVEALGRGGQARVAVAAEMRRNTLIVGSVELSSGRVRRFGSAGRVRVVSVLLILVRTCWWCWTHSWSRSRGVIRRRRCGGRRSRRRCCRRELQRLGHQAGESLVGRMLHYLGYSLQANAKVAEGAQNPDRNAQFEYINARAGEHLAGGEPVISIDCKKKELVGW